MLLELLSVVSISHEPDAYGLAEIRYCHLDIISIFILSQRKYRVSLCLQ